MELQNFSSTIGRHGADFLKRRGARLQHPYFIVPISFYAAVDMCKELVRSKGVLSGKEGRDALNPSSSDEEWQAELRERIKDPHYGGIYPVEELRKKAAEEAQ